MPWPLAGAAAPPRSGSKTVISWHAHRGGAWNCADVLMHATSSARMRAMSASVRRTFADLELSFPLQRDGGRAPGTMGRHGGIEECVTTLYKVDASATVAKPQTCENGGIDCIDKVRAGQQGAPVKVFGDDVADVGMHAVLRGEHAGVRAAGGKGAVGGTAEALHGAAAVVLQVLPEAALAAGHVRVEKLGRGLQLLGVPHQDLHRHGNRWSCSGTLSVSAVILRQKAVTSAGHSGGNITVQRPATWPLVRRPHEVTWHE